MDSLVLGHAALVVQFNTPRAHLPIEVRIAFERATDATEQLFTGCRKTIATSRGFATINETERQEIARVLFNVQTLA